MIIAGTETNLNMRAMEVYIRGCKPPHCKGCHNKGLWEFNGEGYRHEGFIEHIQVEPLRERVFIMGGEPQDQDSEDLYNFISDIKSKGFEVWLFTRYYEVVDKRLLPLLDYVKYGEYQEGKESVTYFGLTLASNNQFIERIEHG